MPILSRHLTIYQNAAIFASLEVAERAATLSAYSRAGDQTRRCEPEGAKQMKPAAFTYHRPHTLEDALSLLALHGFDAKLIAGGQSLAPMMNMRFAQPAHLIDLNALPQLEGISSEGDALVIGAMTRHHEVATSSTVRAVCPLLAEAAATDRK